MRSCFLVVWALLGAAGFAVGQEPRRPSEAMRANLRVTVVVGVGERSKPRATSSYSLLVTSNQRFASFVIGGTLADPADAKASSRDVGAKIKCTAKAAADGLYALELDLETTLPRPPTPNAAANANPNPAVPSSQTMSIMTFAMLRDGQRAQIASGTDPVSGETTWAEVSLAVLE